MFKLGADKITSVLVANDVIEENDFRVYSYGFELLIAFIVNTLCVLIIGAIFGKFFQSILFLITYCPVRQYAGGYHASSYTRCLLTFVIIYILLMFVITNVNVSEFQIPLIVGLFISFIGLIIVSPVEHFNNPLNDQEKIHHKKAAIKLAAISFIVCVLSIGFNFFSNYFIFNTFALYLVFLMAFVAVMQKKFSGCK